MKNPKKNNPAKVKTINGWASKYWFEQKFPYLYRTRRQARHELFRQEIRVMITITEKSEKK